MAINVTKKTVGTHKFIAQVLISVGFIMLVFAFLPQLFHIKLVAIDNLLGIALFIAILIYGIAMYITSVVYECYLDLKATIEGR